MTLRRAGLALLLAFAAGTAACSRIVILNDALSAEEHNDLGVVYEREGKTDLAEREYRRALKRDSRLVRARVNLGNLEAGAGRWKQAEGQYRRALEVEPSDPDALNNLAHVLLASGGNLEEAEAMYREALAIDRTALGNNHPEVASRLINLVVLLGELGRREEAEPLAREAVEMRRRVLGPRHPAMANTLDALAALRDAAVVSAADHQLLSDSYRFLRTIEARLRLMNTTARDDLPDQPQELEKLARHLGFASGEALVSRCRETMRHNRELFDRYTSLR